MWQAKVTKKKDPLHVPERSGSLSLIMAAGARTKCQERRKKRKEFRKLRRLTEFWFKEFSKIEELNKRNRWLAGFRARYGSFIQPVLSAPYIRRSYRLFFHRLAQFSREYTLTTGNPWPMSDHLLHFPLDRFPQVRLLPEAVVL